MESYICKKISTREYTKFFPIERALSLELDDKNELNSRILSKITELEQATRGSTDQQDRILKEYVQV